MKFTWDKIASIIGVSRSTLYRRLEEEGISTCITYSSITDNALDDLIHGIKMQHPHDGERLMIGHLSRHGIRVPRTRLRASIHQVDPVNTALRVLPSEEEGTILMGLTLFGILMVIIK